VSKLREIQQRGGEKTVGRVTSLPVDRLRRVLERASAPMVEHVVPLPRRGGAGAPAPDLVSIRGRNLMAQGLPRVTIGGEPVSVVRAESDEVVIAPLAHQMAGELAIETGPEAVARSAFDLRPYWDGTSGGPDAGDAR
jgi:hypothetical protein